MLYLSNFWLDVRMWFWKCVFLIRRPKQRPTTLDDLYARLTLRKARLKRLQGLEAPEFLLAREQELVQMALREIRVRHKIIRHIYSQPPKD